jgi:hypothetical protein
LNAAGVVEWYDAPAGGTLLGTGTSYTTPALTSGSYTYYVQENGSSAGSADGPLPDILTNLNANFGTVNSLIPSRFDFSDGNTGTCISDGGSDMYDCGNQLNTDLGTLIPYTNGAISSSAALGGSDYFTAKYPGLFVFAADLNGVTSFFTTGNNGADGGGTAEIRTFTYTSSCGATFCAYVKKVRGTTDPSINQMIISPLCGLTQTFATNTNDGNHQVTSLAGSTRIYMLTFARTAGGNINNTAMQNIMDAFVENVICPAIPSANCETVRVPVNVNIGAPPNDAYCNAAPAPLGVSGPYTNCGATSEDTGWSEGTASCAGGSAPTDQNNTIWMSFTPTDNGYYNVTTAGSNNLYDVGGGHDTNDAFDAVLGIYQQTGGTCANPTLSPLGCGSNPAGSVAPTGSYADSVTVSNILMTAGTTYYIQVMGQNYSPGGAGPHNSTSDDIYLNIYPNIILPIEITSFEGETQEETNLITWRTVEEVNGSHFEVERSLDGELFSKLGQVAVKGSNSTYHFVDLEPAQEAYYRLKLVDLDGSFAYTKNIFLRRDAAQALSLELSPNPTPDELHVSYMAEAGNEVSMEISTSEGKVLETRQVRVQKGQNKMSLNFGQYASGMYFLTLIDGDQRTVRKIIKE